MEDSLIVYKLQWFEYGKPNVAIFNSLNLYLVLYYVFNYAFNVQLIFNIQRGLRSRRRKG